MADDTAASTDSNIGLTRGIIAVDRPILPNPGSHEALIEQAECHLRSIGVQPDDDAWQQRRALILRELGR